MKTMAKEPKNVSENVGVDVEKKISESDVIDLLLRQIEKPKNCIKIKATNVYTNRYRINIWTVVQEDGFDKNKITQSYFCIVDSNKIKIIMGDKTP
jgi:hypothetical protein